MRSLGAIVLGISAYRYSLEAGDPPPLKYAAADADAVVAYLKTCWPDGKEAIIAQLGEEQADLVGLETAFTRVAEVDSYDLFLVYLAGHGLVSASEAGFLVQPDAQGGVGLASAQVLDRLLASVTAKRLVFILDCCFAEAVLGRMQFFSQLNGTDARLFIGSSRSDQLTWEDDEAKHGVFTAHLIDMLNAGDTIRPTLHPGRLQVDAELFPYLCDQVPLYVLDHKRARQEPVKGGIASTVVSLPIGRLVRRIRERTAFGTALRRIRQIAATMLCCILVGLGLIYMLIYYAELDRTGEIVLRNGTRWLEPAFRLLPTLRARTGIAGVMLSGDAESRYPVQSGELSGVWTQMSRAGYRGWYDSVRGLIEPRSRERLDTLIGNPRIHDARNDPAEARPSEIETAAWTMLVMPDAATIRWVLQGIPGRDRLDPIVTDFVPGRVFDFTVLDLTPAQIASYAKAIADIAAIAPDDALPVYLGFLKAAQEWLQENNELKRQVELREKSVEAITSALPVLAMARQDRGEPALDQATTEALLALAKRGYFETAGMALARTGGLPPDIRATLTDMALQRFRADLYDPPQLDALNALRSMLDGSARAKASVSRVTAIFRESGSAQNSYLTKFWIDAADRNSLPGDVLNELIDQARAATAKPELEFFDNEVARVLAHAMAKVMDEDKDTAYRLFDAVGASITPISGTMAEIYGSLGVTGNDRPDMLDKVIAQLQAAFQRRKPTAERDDDLPAMQIVVGGTGPWAWALARFGQNRMLPAHATALLKRVTPALPFKEDIEKALVNQTTAGAACTEAICSGPLTHAPADSEGREMEAELLALTIARLPREQFDRSLEVLRDRRAHEVEPEARIALGQAIASARSRRYSSTQ